MAQKKNAFWRKTNKAVKKGKFSLSEEGEKPKLNISVQKNVEVVL